MNHISNRTLIALFIIAIVVVSGSILLILVKLNMIGVSPLTGLAITSGTVNLTVVQSISISLPMNKVEFGANSTGGVTTVINTTTTNNPFFDEPGPLTVQNDGNVIVNLSINGTTAANFIGGSSPVFQFNVTNNETGTCPFVNMTDGSFAPISLAAASNKTNICNSTNFSDASDLLNIHFFLTIPADVSTGLKTAVITITSTSI